VIKKEEMIAAVKECAAKLGHVPNLADLRKNTGLRKYHINRNFGSYAKLLKAAEIEATGCGRRAEMHQLFLDWAAIARRLGKIPSLIEYELQSKYSMKPLLRRFGGWKKVPAGMRSYAIENGMVQEWSDVMKWVADHLERLEKPKPFGRTSDSTSGPTIQDNQLVYGPPLPRGPLAYAPVNENGVLLLFGSVARELGFSILHVQAAFPDCEAMREIKPGRWQRVRIELEYESHNFLTHMHPISGCELIVCWEHNWPECPMEVIELKKVMRDCQNCQDCQRSKGENR
jgi:Homing endonuclease associated repeat